MTLNTCAYYATNPFNRQLGQCIAEATHVVIVAAAAPTGAMSGSGVQAEVCANHSAHLVQKYGAIDRGALAVTAEAATQ